MGQAEIQNEKFMGTPHSWGLSLELLSMTIGTSAFWATKRIPQLCHLQQIPNTKYSRSDSLRAVSEPGKSTQVSCAGHVSCKICDGVMGSRTVAGETTSLVKVYFLSAVTGNFGTWIAPQSFPVSSKKPRIFTYISVNHWLWTALGLGGKKYVKAFLDEAAY